MLNCPLLCDVYSRRATLPDEAAVTSLFSTSVSAHMHPNPALPALSFTRRSQSVPMVIDKGPYRRRCGLPCLAYTGAPLTLHSNLNLTPTCPTSGPPYPPPTRCNATTRSHRVLCLGQCSSLSTGPSILAKTTDRTSLSSSARPVPGPLIGDARRRTLSSRSPQAHTRRRTRSTIRLTHTFTQTLEALPVTAAVSICCRLATLVGRIPRRGMRRPGSVFLATQGRRPSVRWFFSAQRVAVPSPPSSRRSAL
ncbi:hypothetical protein GY45DRAFT_1006110 [Cubamyces sp. BRFM 1775]|nr:hypothetical protein GY45DRAFT_1006110 [Cubamyces sp. BRFM 1775]